MSLDNVNYVEFRADTWDFGYTLWLDGVQFKACNPTGIDDIEATPALQNGCYPNPFTDETTIWFELSEPGRIKLAVYDLNGKCIENLDDSELPAGRHEILFTRKNLAPGIYFYRLAVKTGVATGKIIVE
jgi:hypothetical protein